jgi:hypothetical protein
MKATIAEMSADERTKPLRSSQPRLYVPIQTGKTAPRPFTLLRKRNLPQLTTEFTANSSSQQPDSTELTAKAAKTAPRSTAVGTNTAWTRPC